MATKTKSTKEIILIARFSFKNSNRVVYKVRSNQANKKGRIEGRDQWMQNDLWYDCYEVSCNEDYVCGCQGSGEQCQGSRYKGTCGHRTFVQGLIEARIQVVSVSSPSIESPSVGSSQVAKVHNEPIDIGQRGHVNVSRAFSIGIAV